MFKVLKRFMSIPDKAVTLSYADAGRRYMTPPRIASIGFMAGEGLMMFAGVHPLDFSKWYYSVGGASFFGMSLSYLISNHPLWMATTHLLSAPTMFLANYESFTSYPILSLTGVGLYSASRLFGTIGELAKTGVFAHHKAIQAISRKTLWLMGSTSLTGRALLFVPPIMDEQYLLATILGLWGVSDGCLIYNAAQRPQDQNLCAPPREPVI